MIQILGIGILSVVLLYLQREFYRRFWNRKLTVDITFSAESIFEGEQGQLSECIENRKKLPLPMLKVKFQTDRNLLFDTQEGSRSTDLYYRNDVFQVGGGEKITRTLYFTGGKRGYYRIHSIDLVGTDLFMEAQMTDSVTLNRFLYVLPRPFDTNEFKLVLQQLNGDILARRHLLEDPFEYRGIREYQPFDALRSINWKATAKTGDFKVNQKNYTSLQTVRICMNLEDKGILKKADCVEACIRIAAGLSEFFLQQGIQVSCYANAADLITGKPLFLNAGAGREMSSGILKSLARLNTEQEAMPFCELFEEMLLQEMTGTFTCFIAPNQYEDFTSFLEDYQEQGGEYLWFYPVWESKDPELPAAIAHNIRILHIRK